MVNLLHSLPKGYILSIYTRYLDENIYYYKCFMIVNGEIKTNLNSQSENYCWIDLTCFDGEFLAIDLWQNKILIEQHVKEATLQHELYQYECYLPIDLHSLIIKYVFGITFLDLSS